MKKCALSFGPVYRGNRINQHRIKETSLYMRRCLVLCACDAIEGLHALRLDDAEAQVGQLLRRRHLHVRLTFGWRCLGVRGRVCACGGRLLGGPGCGRLAPDAPVPPMLTDDPCSAAQK